MTQTNNASVQGMTLLNWVLLIGLGIIWGGSFFLNSVALQEIPVLTVVFGRVFFAAIFLLLFLKAIKVKFPTEGKILFAFLIMGGVNNFIPFTMIVAGQTYIGSGLASILNATTPLFAAVVAHIATDEAHERLNAKRIAGILFGVIGVLVLMSPELSSDDFSGSAIIGQLLILGASLSYGVAVVFGRRFGKWGLSPVVAASGQVSGSTLLMLPLMLLVDQPWTFIEDVTYVGWGSVLGLSLLCTALAYIIYFRLIKSAGATNASLVTLIVPASAVILGAIFLNELITATTIAGFALIIAGLLVIDGRILTLMYKKSPA